MRKAFLALAAVVCLAAGLRSAAAASNHERAKFEELKDASGAVIGAKLSITLRPNDRSRNVVRVGLGPITATGGLSQANRDNASDFSKGYLAYQWPEITFKPDELNKPQPMTLEVKFADAPKLAALIGKDVEVLTTWNNDKHTSYWHVWGLQTSQVDKASVLRVPGTAMPAATTASTRIAPSRARLAPRRATAARRIPTRTARSRVTRTR